MSQTISQIQAGRLAHAYNLAAARGWVLAPRPITIAELAAGTALAQHGRSDRESAIEQGTALIAHFVRRERMVLPAAIVLIGKDDLLDWALANVARSAHGIAREMFGYADGDTVLVLTPAVRKAPA